MSGHASTPPNPPTPATYFPYCLDFVGPIPSIPLPLPPLLGGHPQMEGVEPSSEATLAGSTQA